MTAALDFRTTSVIGLAEQVRMGKTSARELARAAYDRIAETNPAVNAVVAVDEDLAMQEAARVDDVVARGGDPGPLPPISGRPGTVNGAESPGWVSFTYPFNMTRSPAGTVCAGISEAGVPVGLQVVGPQHGDLVVLRAMAVLEAALDPGMVAPL